VQLRHSALDELELIVRGQPRCSLADAEAVDLPNELEHVRRPEVAVVLERATSSCCRLTCGSSSPEAHFAEQAVVGVAIDADPHARGRYQTS